MCDNMEFQYNTYVKNNYKLDALSNTNTMTVVITDFTKSLSRISEELKKRFLDNLKNVKELSQFVYVFVDRVDNLKKIEYDEWYKRVVQSNYGIWIGNGIADQTFIKTNIGFKKTNNEIPEGFGICVKNTKTYLVKLVNDTEINSKVDDIDE